jgi:hypothetical protein
MPNPTPVLGNEVTFSYDIFAKRPQVLPLPNNHFVLAWEDATNIFARLLDANGSFVGGDFLSVLSANDPKQLSGPRLFRQTNGHVVVTYQRQFSPNDIDVHWHLVDTNFTPTGGAAPIENSALNEVLRDSTSRTGGGGAIVFELPQVFGTSLHTYTVLRFIDQLGNPTSNQIFVGPHSGESQQNAAAAGLHNGNVAVAYENYNWATQQNDIRVHIYRPDGTDGGAGELHLTSGVPPYPPSFPAAAVLKDGSFVVAWQVSQSIAFRHVSQEGVADPPVNAVPGIIPGTFPAFLPKITALNDGGFLLAWTAGSGYEQGTDANLDLFLQRYRFKNNVLNPVGTQVHIEPGVGKPGDQFALSIATLPDGRVILAYASETGDATNITTLNYRFVFIPPIPSEPWVDPEPQPPLGARQRAQVDTVEPNDTESDIGARQPAAQ